MNLVSSILIVSLLTIGCVFGESSDSAAAAAAAAPGTVKCFECNEVEDRRCRDPFSADKSLIITCPEGVTFCRKTVQYVNGKSSVIRQCAKELYKPGYEGCYKTAGKSTQNVCTCKGNSENPCNNGFVMKSSILAIVLSVVLACFVKY